MHARVRAHTHTGFHVEYILGKLLIEIQLYFSRWLYSLVLNHLLNNPSFPHWCEMTVIFLKLGFHTRYFPNKLNLTHYRPQYARTYYIFEVLFISPYTSNLAKSGWQLSPWDISSITSSQTWDCKDDAWGAGLRSHDTVPWGFAEDILGELNHSEFGTFLNIAYLPSMFREVIKSAIYKVELYQWVGGGR